METDIKNFHPVGRPDRSYHADELIEAVTLQPIGVSELIGRYNLMLLRISEQARQLEEARKAIERCAAYIGSIDHGENTKSYMMCDAWLATNAPAPQTQPEQYMTATDDRMFDE